MAYKKRRYLNKLEHIIFGTLNEFLAQLIEKTNCSKIIFDFFARVLPIPQAIVKGVPIKVIIPLNQVGVYNTFKNWENREPEVLDWIDGFEPHCTFFDVGAGFGTETLYAALKRNGPNRIVSFDLCLQASFNLSYNISLNNIKNVDQYYIALLDDFKIIPFAMPTNYNFVKGKEKYDRIPFNTLSISMDQFIEMSRIFPDYIKIDVDGAEPEIILGMTETVQNKRLKSVVVEVSDNSEPAITEFFERAGFKIEFERRFDDGKIFYKNIIFTRR
jgi:FkbM family methyltransferase